MGKKHTEETKQKMAELKKGENNPNYGKTFSAEYRAKLSESQKGRKHSEETKAKMRAARKKYYENPENREKQSKAMKGNRNSRKFDILMIGVDYEEYKPETYRGCEVYNCEDIKEQFQSGDFEIDLKNAECRADVIAKKRNYVIYYSSSYDNYLMDRSN